MTPGGGVLPCISHIYVCAAPKGRASRPNMPGCFVPFAPVPRRSKLTSYHPETPPQPVDTACKWPSDNRICSFDVYVVHNSPSRNFLSGWNFASGEFVKEWAVVPAEYVNVDSQYLAWISSSGWLSSSKSRCYETHWNCAVGLAAMLPSISHVYQRLTWTRLGKIRQNTGSLKMICWKLKQI